MDTDTDIAFEIDELRLTGFVAEQVRLIAETPLPGGLADELRRAGAELDLAAVWLGAGLATQIGLPLLEHPEAFVRRRPPAEGSPPADTPTAAAPQAEGGNPETSGETIGAPPGSLRSAGAGRATYR